jgi:transcriptional regulator CtsR
VKVNVKRKSLKSSLRRPLLITLLLIWSFCIAPVAQADTVILTNPSNLVAITISNSQINLTWTDNASNEIGYTVERRVGSGSYSVIANLIANSTTYIDSGLTSGTAYTYRVMALGNGSNITSSGYSGEASATTSGGTSPSGALNTPGNLTAAPASANQINLHWIDYATGETGYIVERATDGATFSILGYLSPDSQAFFDPGLMTNATYSYRVQARGNGSTIANSAYSNVASVTLGTSSVSLTTPTGLTATAVTSSQVNLLWADNATGEIGYNIERFSAGNNTFVLIAYLGPNAQSFSDTGLTVNTSYTYRVQARGSLTNSGYSNEATVTTGTAGVLTAPAYLLATPVSGSQINLAWTDSATGESGYNVERKTTDGSYSIIAYLATDVQAYSDTGLQGGTTYTYRVQARGNGSTIPDSTYSIEASATTAQAASKKTILRFYIGRMYYYLNDEGQFMDTAPVLQANRTLLPITYAALPLGVEVDWKQTEQKVTLTRSGKVIELWIGKNTATVNGEQQYIDANNAKVVPTVIKGRTMLPLAFVAQALDCAVDWDASTQEVKITYPKP